MGYWKPLALACAVATVFAASIWVPRCAAAERTLAKSRDDAIGAIERNQGPEGYWTTLYTPLSIFQSPKIELNNFLAPIMIDLLQPIAEKMNLNGSLERARAYTAAQIDDGGLVQFNPSTNPILKTAPSCTRITPDADDTALAWTLSRAPNLERLAAVLGILRSFRTEDGLLFRTWLAAEKDFQCLVPGSEPNPPDIGINLHVYLFLLRYDAVEARSLCQALIHREADPSFWVYYQQAPLLPLLRISEVRRTGCAIEIPAALVRPVDHAQARWLDVLSLMYAELTPGSEARDRALSLLVTLAQDDFAAVETAPPLLYHNDLTSRGKRSYWSKDIGYALWLRLYARLGM